MNCENHTLEELDVIMLHAADAAANDAVAAYAAAINLDANLC